MRLFVAVDVSDETRAQLRRVRHRLERRLAAGQRPPRITWVAAEVAHVTLRFIGEVPEPVAERVRHAMERAFDQPVFEMQWMGLGTFPRGRTLRVIWIAPSAGSDAAVSLAAAVNDRLDQIVGAGDARPFRPHLAVGRIKDAGSGIDWQEMLGAIRTGTTRSRVDHVTLYRSRLSPNGPTYTALSKTTLRPG